ncbi:MAG: inositol monophosphatase family protein [Cyanobacteria bacterium P01_A01_bin.135]
MSPIPSPRDILAALLPHLRVAAAYSRQIQSRIASQPEKGAGDNFFAAALTDADLSIQTFVEVALLGLFPDIRFHGEEYEKTYNTKYFRATDLGPMGDYLVTLDPIDGTRFYLDNHPNYQIILGVLNADDYEAVLAITPAQDCYYYALRGQGAFVGQLSDDLEDCQPLQVDPATEKILLGWDMGRYGAQLGQYKIVDVRADYSKTVAIQNVNGLLSGELSGAMLRGGKFIDGAAIAFLAQQAGCILTTLTGEALAPLEDCQNNQRSGLIIAASEAIHRDLMSAYKSL